MRRITYAGGTVKTTDRIAATLVELTAALARRGLAEVVRIPVFAGDGRPAGDADLVVGVGVEVLSTAAPSTVADPACGDETAQLERMLRRVAAADGRPTAAHYDRVLDDPEFAHSVGDRPEPPVRLRPRTRPRELR